MRAAWVRAHRYVGLALAGFLCVIGITGALLAWNDTLDMRLNPALLRASPPQPNATPLDPLDLRARVAAQYPDAHVRYAPLVPTEGGAYVFYLQARGDVALPDDQVFINPYTGAVQGARRWGDIGQGVKNLMPFVERLHYSLALGVAGTYAFGVIALLWTLDCFVGAWLTLPPRAASAAKNATRPANRPANRPATSRRQHWFARWTPAWKLRLGGGRYKLTFDLHRAGGLWLWFMLFVFAWSGVSFNLPAIYEPAMRALLPHQAGEAALPAPGVYTPDPVLPWKEALAAGRHLMEGEASRHDFHVIEEAALQYDAWRAVYAYSVRSSADVRTHNGLTTVMFDANTGARLSAWIPTGAAAGDTVRSWLASLHMATMWGWPFKAFVSVMGLATALLSITGVLIWRKKKRGRRRA